MEDSTIHQVADGVENLQTSSPGQVSKQFSFSRDLTQSPNADGLPACKEPPALKIKHNRGFEPRGGFPMEILRILERWHEACPDSTVGHPAKINLNTHRPRNFKIFDEDANEFEMSIWDVSKARRPVRPLLYHVMIIHSEHGPDQLCADAIARGSLHDISTKTQGQYIFAWDEAEAKFDDRFFALRVWRSSDRDIIFSPRFFECEALPRHPPAIYQLGWVSGSRTPEHVGSNWEGDSGKNPSIEKGLGGLGGLDRPAVSVEAPKRVRMKADPDPDYVDEPRPRVVVEFDFKDPKPAEPAPGSAVSTLSPGMSIPSPVDSTLGPCVSPIGALSPMAGSSMAEIHLIGSPMAGFPMAGSQMAEIPLAGSPMAGSHIPGSPMEGVTLSGGRISTAAPAGPARSQGIESFG